MARPEPGVEIAFKSLPLPIYLCWPGLTPKDTAAFKIEPQMGHECSEREPVGDAANTSPNSPPGGQPGSSKRAASSGRSSCVCKCEEWLEVEFEANHCAINMDSPPRDAEGPRKWQLTGKNPKVTFLNSFQNIFCSSIPYFWQKPTVRSLFVVRPLGLSFCSVLGESLHTWKYPFFTYNLECCWSL